MTTVSLQPVPSLLSERGKKPNLAIMAMIQSTCEGSTEATQSLTVCNDSYSLTLAIKLAAPEILCVKIHTLENISVLTLRGCKYTEMQEGLLRLAL